MLRGTSGIYIMKSLGNPNTEPQCAGAAAVSICHGKRSCESCRRKPKHRTFLTFHALKNA